MAKVDQKQLRRLSRRFVVDALGGEPELEANKNGVRLGEKTVENERNLPPTPDVGLPYSPIASSQDL